MTGDHHGWTAGMATLLVKAVDGILGTHNYNTARPHCAPGQHTPAHADTRPPEPVNLADHRIRQKQVLGGLTREYYCG